MVPTDVSTCGKNNCNLVNLTITDGQWFMKQTSWADSGHRKRINWQDPKYGFGVGVDGKGRDRETQILIEFISKNTNSRPKSLFWAGSLLLRGDRQV